MAEEDLRGFRSSAMQVVLRRFRHGRPNGDRRSADHIDLRDDRKSHKREYSTMRRIIVVIIQLVSESSVRRRCSRCARSSGAFR